MAIQMRRGQFAKFDKSKMLPGEFAVVLSGDAEGTDGSGLYICVSDGNVKRIPASDDVAAIAANRFAELADVEIAELEQTVQTAINELSSTEASAIEAMQAKVDSVTASAKSEAMDAVKQSIADADSAASRADAASSVAERYAKALIHGHAEGTVAQCDMSAELPLQEVRVEGATSQNLFPKSNNRTQNGITISVNDDGSVKFSGTALSPGMVYFMETNLLKMEKQYFLSGNSGGVELRVSDRNSNLKQIGWRSANSAFTLTSGTTTCYCGFVISEGTTVNTTIYPMLVEGSEARAFTPCGKITNVEGQVEIVRCGKNLLDDSKCVNAFISKSGSITESFNFVLSDYVRVDGGKSYILYPTPQGTNAAYCIFDSAKHYISGATFSNYNKDIIITIPSNGAYLRTSIRTNDAANAQLERGTKATAYEPYTEERFTLTIPDGEFMGKLPNDTADEIVVKDGQATLMKRVLGVTLNGSENWLIDRTSTSEKIIFGLSNGIPGSVASIFNGKNALSSRYVSNKNTETDKTITSYVSGWINIRDDSYANDLNGFKANLANNPCLYMCEAATPRTVDLGAIDLPDGVYSITNVYATNDQNLTQTVEVDYIQDATLVVEDLRNSIVESATE